MESILIRLLELQTKRYLRRHKPKLIAITGSVGKTSTKFFTHTILSQHFTVRWQEGNHNTHISVPLVIFGITFPKSFRNPLIWLTVLFRMEQKIHKEEAPQAIVLELGADHPGDIPRFGTYLQPDISVVTSIAAEHMEFFKTLDAVAREELSTANFSKSVLLSKEDIAEEFLAYVTRRSAATFGINGTATYHFLTEDFTVEQGFRGKFVSPQFGEMEVTIPLLGEHNIRSAVAAAAVATQLGLSAEEIRKGLQAIVPVKGRMHLLRGLKDTILIDDTYNSSPIAAAAALQTLYTLPGKQKIAILGSMNELGDTSPEAHKELGMLCDPTLLDWVITIGDDAAKYLAPAAQSRGCQVKSFKSPYEAGGFAHAVMHPGAIILAKGSQNGVFAEEALKELLHETVEETQLVRQSPFWMAIKERQFDPFAHKQPTGE